MTAKAKTLLRGVRVFDGESFLPQLQDVLIADGAVEKVTTASGTAAQEQELAASDIEVIDAAGHTLTPGIIDCHVHVCFSEAGSLASFTEPFSLQFYKSVDHLQRTLR
ncbi:amidohydrolase family protein, partial [Brevibacterium otitidis]